MHLVIDGDIFILSGALFHSLVASPMYEFMIKFDDPSSISLSFVTPLVVLESIGVCCLWIFIGYFGMFLAFQMFYL